MINVNFYLNDVLVNPPKNWQELSIELNFDKDKDSARESLTITDFDWVRENQDSIISWISAGKIFEGMPLRIEIERNGVIEKPFNGYLDLVDRPRLSKQSDSVLVIKSKERKRIDWLNDVADSFTFEYLYKVTGELTQDDFVPVPYVISSIPNYFNAALALLSVFVIGEQIRAAIQKILELAASLSNPFEITSIIRLTLYIIYLAVLIITIVKLIKDLINSIIQPVKYHMGMYVKRLLEIGASHLGLTFKSDIFEDEPYSEDFILPQKYNIKLDNTDFKIFGHLSPNANEQEGYFKGTFGELLRAVKAKYNSKIIITSANELWIVNQHYNLSQPTYQLPDVYQPYYTTNAHELISNYYLTYQVDLSETNTYTEYEGTAYQVITQPISIGNADLSLMKGYERVNIPFALGKRKTDLTVPEVILSDFLGVFDVIVNGLISAINACIDVYNNIVGVIEDVIDALDFVGIDLNFNPQTINNIAPVNLGNIITNRIGMLKLEADFFNTPKNFILIQGTQPKFNKLPTTNKDDQSAKTLYDLFHYTNSFIPTNDRPYGNQSIIKEFEKVPFSLADFQKVKDNNFILDANAKPAEIASLKWNIFNQYANMEVRFSEIYTTNLKQLTLYPDGK